MGLLETRRRGAGLALAAASAAAVAVTAITGQAAPASAAAPPAGALLAWGSNSGGQLGNGGTADAADPGPVALPAGSSATGASAGSTHALAVTAAGQVLSWGTNSSGQLGNGTTTSTTTPVAVPLPSGTTATAVSAGTGFSLALTSAGQVLAWGGNKDGELGNGSTNSSSTPVHVQLPAGATAAGVAAGGRFGLAVTTGGQVLAWGFGALGNGAQSSDTPVQVALPSGTRAAAVSAGGAAGYALTSAGQILAWGDGSAGQLGDNTTADSSAPVSVQLPAGVSATAISGTAQSALALTSAGGILSWGTGALGAGPATATSLPVDVALPSGVAAVALGAGPDAASALAVTQPVPAAGPVTSPTLECQVITSDGVSGGASTGTCGTFRASSSYVIDLGVSNPGASLAWTLPAGPTVVAGCTAATPFCDLSIRAATADRTFVTSVVTDNSAGQPVQLSATADLPAVCGSSLC